MYKLPKFSQHPSEKNCCVDIKPKSQKMETVARVTQTNHLKCHNLFFRTTIA